MLAARSARHGGQARLKKRKKRTDVITVSYSAAQDFRLCEQRYAYRYIDKIEPRVRETAPELGSVLHDYLEAFYRRVQRGRGPAAAHRRGVKAVRDHKKELRSLARVAAGLGAEEAAQALGSIVPNALVIAEAYWRVHGKSDAKRKPVLVEEEFELLVAPGIVLPGRIDLVTKEKGDLWLWEHKSTTRVPEHGRRFRDLQTFLYAIAVEEMLGKQVAGVAWNYLRTVPLHPPALLKSGRLSLDRNQNTTSRLYRDAIEEHGFSLSDYRPFLRHLEEREKRLLFPRHRLPVAGSPDVLLRDYLATAERVADVRTRDGFVPVRNIGGHCDWCPYRMLCQAAVTGGTTEELRANYFKRIRKKPKAKRKAA